MTNLTMLIYSINSHDENKYYGMKKQSKTNSYIKKELLKHQRNFNIITTKAALEMIT